MVYKTPLIHAAFSEHEKSAFDLDVPVSNIMEANSGAENDICGSAKKLSDCTMEQVMPCLNNTTCNKQCDLSNTKISSEKNKEKLLERGINEANPKTRKLLSDKKVLNSRRITDSNEKSVKSQENAEKKLKIEIKKMLCSEQLKKINKIKTKSKKDTSKKSYKLNDGAKETKTKQSTNLDSTDSLKSKCLPAKGKTETEEQLNLNDTPISLITFEEEPTLECNTKEVEDKNNNTKTENLLHKNNNGEEFEGEVSYIEPKAPANVSTKTEVTSEVLINEPEPTKYSCDNCRCKFEVTIMFDFCKCLHD